MTDAQPDGLYPEAVPAEEGENTSFGRWLLELIGLVLVAFLLATAIKTWVVQPFFIPSSSMEKTLLIGDRVLVNKFIYRFQEPQPGDVVVFLAPGQDDTDYIKRVVAVQGQTVEVENGRLIVDGLARSEPYVNGDVEDGYSSTAPVKVPDGEVFLMGDNRPFSKDSRYFGTQPTERILGKAFAVYWPLGRVKGL